MTQNNIPTTKDYTKRINRLVDAYENQIVAELNEQYSQKTTHADRLSDQIAAFAGSWRFIIIFVIFLVVWTTWNLLNFTFHFDNPPFILLNLILSFIAAFQAPIIIMSQNRQAARDKHEAVIDFSINYKAELEINDMQSHLHRIEQQVSEIRKILQTSHAE